jgi:hypothetical protein
MNKENNSPRKKFKGTGNPKRRLKMGRTLAKSNKAMLNKAALMKIKRRITELKYYGYNIFLHY